MLIIGCGDVGLRVAQGLPQRVRVLALTSSAHRVPELRAHHITPLLGNLDDEVSLRRLAGLATHVMHLAPPPNACPTGTTDPRTAALLRALRLRALPSVMVYGSTSGVYGNCRGDLVDETRTVNPQTARAQRRVHAEGLLRLVGRATGTRVHVLRIPGIYAPDREGGTPRARLLRAAPVLLEADDVYTNHIHATDLARACRAAMWRGKPQRVTHVSDDTQLKMGDYFDMAADLYGLSRPPRMSFDDARQQLPALQLSFMAESRRLVNQRLKRELRLTLQFPTAASGLV